MSYDNIFAADAAHSSNALPVSTGPFDSGGKADEELRIGMLKKKASQRLRDYRNLLGLTQSQFAECIKLTQQEISEMERTGDISLGQLYKLKSMGIHVEDFFQLYLEKDSFTQTLEDIYNLRKGGVIRVYPTREDGLKNLKDHIDNEHLGIHIVGSTLQGLRLCRIVLDAMEKRVRAGVKVKLLLSHPAFTCLRAFAEDRNAEAISLEIYETIDGYASKLEKIAQKEGQVQTRIALVPSSIFAVFLISQKVALINSYTMSIEGFSIPSLMVFNTGSNECFYKKYHVHGFANPWYCNELMGREISIDLKDPRMDKKRVKEAKINFKKALDSVVRKEPKSGENAE